MDNVVPTVALPSAQDIAGTGATTDVTVTATAGPSGVHAITCNVDSGTAVVYPDPAAQPTFSAQIPVSGLGSHQITCTGQSNAASSSGALASSSPASTTLTIREPSSAAVTFAKLADPAICHTTVRRRHGKRVKRRVCKLRTVKRRETVIVKRHGKPVKVHRTVTIVLLPHVVLKASQRIPYGHATTVSGALGAAGAALAGAPITVLAAPDNGSGTYTPIASATTGPAGTWTVRIPAGPSRLIEAVYPGSATTEPTTSTPVTLTVPAKIRIASIRPRHVRWGSVITIHAELFGGYLPPAGELVELRYRYGRAETTYGVKTHVTTATFTTRFTFGPGQTPVMFGFQMRALPAGDYPYAEASSNTFSVAVAGQLPSSSRQRRHRRRHHGAGSHHHHRAKKTPLRSG